MFVKMSLREQLNCLVDFVGMILLSLLLLPKCFLRLCFITLSAAVLKDFLPLITSPISGAANTNMSVPMLFAAETTFLRKKRIAVLTIICAKAQILLPPFFQPIYIMELLFVLKQPSRSIVCVRNECWTPF